MNPQLQLMLQQAIQAFQGGNFDGAESILKRIMQVDSKNLPALHILGLIKISQSDYRLAADYLAKAARIHPNDSSIQYNLAKALSDSGNDKDALAHHKKAVALASNNPEAWLNYGKTASNLGHYEDALGFYDNALRLKPAYAEALLNKGATLKELKRYEEAISFAEQALLINPDLAEAWSNKGVALKALERFDEAIASYDKALDLKPNYAEAWSNKGLALHELKCFDGAIVHFDKALSLKSDIDWVPGNLLHAKMRICDWNGIKDLSEKISKKVDEGKKVSQPFPLLALSDDALIHKRCSEIFTKAKYPSNSALGFIRKSSKKEKIRIAYFSPDFRNHPVSFLTSELFEVHDRTKFEVFAFSLQNTLIGDETNSRLRKGFDKFIDVDDMSDREIAQLARELEIDIAIDLAGPTQHARTGIFSYRAAPIQVNWLGYPGTIGADFIDYIVADKTIVPASHQQFYSEKIVYLPNTYIVDDSKRIPSDRVFTREECGLPPNAFVFCCFNNDYKFNPRVLDSWARILLSVNNGVIWISDNNECFRVNIAAEFQSRGIDLGRIIFAQRVERMADHLSRYALADLFLDTSPYNAHTTALDSLKAGIPVVTLMGQSFASRVAASLLNAIDLPELILNTQEEYEALVIELATTTQKLSDIKFKLANNRLTAPIFDTPLFARNLEVAYIQMMERYWADLRPEHILIS